MIKIDTGILIPPIRRGKRKYPFLEMEIEDSFLVECQEEPRARDTKIVQVYTCLKRCKKRHGLKIKITARSVPGGVRFWRINDDGSIPATMLLK